LPHPSPGDSLANDLPLVGALVILIGFVELAFLFWRGNRSGSSILAFGLLTALSGAMIANLTDVTDMVVSLGGANSIHLQRAVADVRQQAQQVQAVREELRGVVRALMKTHAPAYEVEPETSMQSAQDEFLINMNKLADFAYPDVKEREAEKAKLN
jgi:hypothetical protein